MEAAVNLYQGKVNSFRGLSASGKSEICRTDAPNRTLSGGRSRLRRCCAEPDVQFYEQSDAGTRQTNPEDMPAVREAVQEVQALKRPIYADEADHITRNFRQILAEMKQDGPERVKQTAALTKQKMNEITKEYPRQGNGLQLHPKASWGCFQLRWTRSPFRRNIRRN